MPAFVNVADLKDPSDTQGRTYRQINAAKTHSIPVGSLVELFADEYDDSDDGVRLYVVHLGRDCDQTPLYYLSANRYDTGQEHTNLRNRTWVGGYSEGSLRVVRKPKEER